MPDYIQAIKNCEACAPVDEGVRLRVVGCDIAFNEVEDSINATDSICIPGQATCIPSYKVCPYLSVVN